MQPLAAIRKWLQKPVPFEHTGKYLIPGAALLDVGCGSKAPYSTLEHYPLIRYSGIDYSDIDGKNAMENFFKCDIDNNPLVEIPDNYYDVISLSHIIEHVQHGGYLIQALVKKLKPGGVIYIETPSEKSMHLPSWYGTLNFYDDPTHKRLYSLKEIETVLKEQECIVLRSGVRRSFKRIVLSPLYILLSLFRDGKINAATLWDIVGFAHYTLAKKT